MYKNIGLSATLLLTLAGCGAVPEARAEFAAPLSDEQLFRGSFFLQGTFGENVASAFGPQLAADYASMRAAHSKDYNEFVDKVVTQIGKSNPQFISGFASHVRSADYLAVQNDINSAEGVFIDAIEAAYNIPHEKFMKVVSAAREAAGELEENSSDFTGIGTQRVVYKATDLVVAAYGVLNVAAIATQVGVGWGYVFAVYAATVVIPRAPGTDASALKEQVEAATFINTYARYTAQN